MLNSYFQGRKLYVRCFLFFTAPPLPYQRFLFLLCALVTPFETWFLFWRLRLQFRSVALPVHVYEGYGRNEARGTFFFRGRALYSEGVSTHSQEVGSFLQRVVTALTKDVTKDVHTLTKDVMG